MSGEAPRPPREIWRGTRLSVDTVNRLRPVEARLYSMIAMHAATHTRCTLTLLGAVRDDRGVPLGAAAARRMVSDLHDQGLLIAGGWAEATADTPLTFFLSGQAPPARLPRQLRGGEDRIKVGGRFTAPRTLERDLLDTLVATGRLLKDHQQVTAAERDAKWIEHLAVYTEQRAAAFHRWAAIEGADVVRKEAHRLTKAAQDIRVQATNRYETEARQRAARKKEDAAT